LGEVLINPSSDPGRSQELFGLQVSETARVMNAARGNQILCTRTVYDNARAALTGGPLEKNARILWFNHGPYRLKGIEDPVEICEFGDTSIAPMKPPLESPDCRRVSMLYTRNRRRTPIMLVALPVLLLALAAAFGVYRVLPGAAPAISDPGAASDIAPANPALITRYRMRLPDEYPLARP